MISRSGDGRLGVKSGHGLYDDNDQRVAELTLKLYQLARQLDRDPTWLYADLEPASRGTTRGSEDPVR
jgi:hypothetical protein